MSKQSRNSDSDGITRRDFNKGAAATATVPLQLFDDDEDDDDGFWSGIFGDDEDERPRIQVGTDEDGDPKFKLFDEVTLAEALTAGEVKNDDEERVAVELDLQPQETADKLEGTDIRPESVSTDELSIGDTVDASTYNGAVGSERIQAAADDYGTDPCTIVVRDEMWNERSTVELPDNTVLKFINTTFQREDSNADYVMIENAGAETASDATANQNVHVVIGENSTVDGRAVELGNDQANDGNADGALVLFRGVTNCTTRGEGEIRNACRHGLEWSFAKACWSHGHEIYNCSDDPVSVADGSRTIYGSQGDSVTDGVWVRDVYCHDIKNYGNFAGSVGPEAEDGVSNVWFVNVSARKADSAGAKIHQHSGEVPPENINYVGCDLGLTVVDRDVGDVYFDDCTFDGLLEGPQKQDDSSRWPDHIEVSDCRLEEGFDMNAEYASGRYKLDGCHILDARNTAPDSKYVRLEGCVWDVTGKSKNIQFDPSARPKNCDFFVDSGQIVALNRSGDGGLYRLEGCYSEGGDRGFRVYAGANGAILEDCEVGSTGFSNAIQAITGSLVVVRNMHADGNSVIIDDSSIAEAYVEGCQEVGSYTLNATRMFKDGTEELSGAPTASNYDSTMSGYEVLDTSTSPPDVYRVLQDGSVAGPL
jgi:hypothetical protein